METAVAYVRVSSQRQVDEGSSLDSQTKHVTEYAKTQGYYLKHIFREEGESAKTDQRPRLQEMLSYCKEHKGEIKVVIIAKIDRLARNVFDYTRLKLQLGHLNIKLESLGERIEDSPAGRFTETVMASMAQFDNEVRAERSRDGIVEAVSQGRWVWRPPVGYRSVRHEGKGTIEPDPTTAPAVREAFRLLAFGHQGAAASQEFLRQSGVARTQSTFYRLVRNEAYIGVIKAFGRVYQARPPFIPLVDERTFRRAQFAISSYHQPRKLQKESEDFPLRGTMRCVCGRLFTGSWSRGRHGERYAYYRCPHCDRPSYRREAVHQAFDRELSLYVGSQGAWEKIRFNLVQHEDHIKLLRISDFRQASELIDKLKGLRDTIVLKNAAGVVPDDIAKEQILKLGREIEAATALLPSSQDDTQIDDLLSFAQNFLGQLKESWNHSTLKNRRDLLRFMFPEGILYCPDRGFRTAENSLPEEIKSLFLSKDSRLGSFTPEFSNQLLAWFTELRRTVCGQETTSEAPAPSTRRRPRK